MKYNIINLCQKNKYFSIILDCIPDVSHTEQIYMIEEFHHFINWRYRSIEIHEHILAFSPILDAAWLD